MWRISGATPFNMGRAEAFMNSLYPNEQHRVGGDCINPKCQHEWTPEELNQAEKDGGWIDCPNCHTEQNIWDDEIMETRVALTKRRLGQIGENVVQKMGEIPMLGKITWTSNTYQFPIDMIAGDFGVEIKTNSSEAQPRFRLGGGNNADPAQAMKGKLQYVQTEGLRPALVGVRLNFYTDKADIFVRPDSFSETWIGAPTLHHVATVDFKDLNPYKDPSQVPPPNEMPDEDDDSEFPF